MANLRLLPDAGATLRAKRITKHLTVATVAQRAHLSTKTVSKIEGGNRRVFEEATIIRVCGVLGMKVADLIESNIDESIVLAQSSDVHLYDVFLSAPMASQPREYAEARAELEKIAKFLSDSLGLTRIFCPSLKIENEQDFEDEAIALVDNLVAIRRSACLIAVYPARLVSSVLVEIGMALALDIPTAVLYRERDDLPFLLRSSTRAPTKFLMVRARNTQERLHVLLAQKDFLRNE